MDEYIELMKKMRSYADAKDYWEVDDYLFKVYLGEVLLGDLEHYGLQYKHTCDFRQYESWGPFCEVLISCLYDKYMKDEKEKYPPGKYRVDVDKHVLSIIYTDSFKLYYHGMEWNMQSLYPYISCTSATW